MFSGDKAAWPLYLTIGNIPKSIRHKTSVRATILVAYLPVPNLGGISSDDKRAEARNRLFHQCMKVVLDSLHSAGSDGREVVCSDSSIRRIYPLVAAYIADFPEQCLITCCRESRCPICEVPHELRGDSHTNDHPVRTHHSTLSAIAGTIKATFDTYHLLNLGLRPTWPFWSKLPHMSIFNCITPDVLHQLHKGLFKDHLVKWCGEIVGKAELDRRFKSVPRHPGIRHFSKVISHVKQWTGREHREMEKVFLSIVAGAKTAVVKASRSILDYIYISHFTQIRESDIRKLDSSLSCFHDNKSVFASHIKSKKGFNGIPKIHNISHQSDSIRRLGTPDNFTSEDPELCHIHYAKDGYRASNKNNPTQQMVLYLQRSEAVRQWTSFLHWSTGFPYRKLPSIDEEYHEPSFVDNDEADTHDDDTHSSINSPVLVLSSAISQPNPSITIAKRGYLNRWSAELISSRFNISNFVSVVDSFLADSLPHSVSSRQLSSPDSFELWVRFKLIHNRHGLLAIDKAITESVQARPSQFTSAGKLLHAPISTSVLVLDKPDRSDLTSELLVFVLLNHDS